MSRRSRSLTPDPSSYPSSRAVVRMTTAAQVVAAIPHQLGFTPTESLVVLCCHEPRGQIGLSMRVDLPDEQVEPVLVDSMVDRVRHERATRVVLALYTEQDGPLPRQNLIDDLRLQLEDLVITEALLVRGGRFWSYVCSEPECCPAVGRSVAEAVGSAPVLLLAAENVLAGRSVLPTRAALAASVAGPVLLAAQAARQRCERALDTAESELSGTGSLRPAVDDWRAAVDRWRDPPTDLGDREAARLAMALHSKAVRDEVATWVADDRETLLALVAELCRRTPAPYDAPVATLLGWLTYACGGGALVVIALERALATDPDYAMARMLLDLSNAQVPSAVVRRLLAQEARRLGSGSVAAGSGRCDREGPDYGPVRRQA